MEVLFQGRHLRFEFLRRNDEAMWIHHALANAMVDQDGCFPARVVGGHVRWYRHAAESR